MIDTTRRQAGIVLAGLLMLAGCGGVHRVPEDSFYRLDTTVPTERLAKPVLNGVLAVQAGAAAPLYRDRSFLFSEPDSPHKLQRYHYHYWVDTPPRLLQHGLADYLRSAGVATTIVVPEDGVDEDYRLRLEIGHFEHVRGTHGGKVVVGLDMLLSERATGKLLMQDHLQTEMPVNGVEFSAVAMAYQQALGKLYADILVRLRTVQSAAL